MDLYGRLGFAALSLFALLNLFPDPSSDRVKIEGVPEGKTRVIDLSYAISDKLVPWPGDTKFFEAKVNATVE